MIGAYDSIMKADAGPELVTFGPCVARVGLSALEPLTSALSARFRAYPQQDQQRAKRGLKTDLTKNSTFEQLCRSLHRS